MAESRPDGEALARSADQGAAYPNPIIAALDAARAGCAPSFDQVTERCRAYLLHVAARELGEDLRGKVGASDLVQETLLEARETFDRFRGQTEEELLGWLRQILLHKLAHAGRHYRGTAKRNIAREVSLEAPDVSGQVAYDLADGSATPSKQMMAEERVVVLRQAIGRLSPAHRQVILLRSVEQRPFDQIGLIMQRSEKAVCKLWARAVEALRQELGATHDSL